ncbi:nuclease subunit B homolog [Candidatus Moduliflexus flocculans]|uniref:Nuclease subunit B homolog n=1 Tax=Candidatus Moduliflexus flocculans TaxID=1499966 RepID=A0A0S6VVD3_9BACT|nr:nuclease subunit B homolog [Candidatus Moduliflexus flocculans]
MKLMGKIDRIDAEAGNDGEARTKAILVDYKSGSVPSMTEMKRGLHFQMPLYLLALRDLLGDRFEVIGSAYYQVKSPHEIGLKSLLITKEDLRRFSGATAKNLFESPDELLAFLCEYANRAAQIHAQIQHGEFPPTTLGETAAKCEWCDYRRICRVDHQRMANIVSDV